MKTTKLQKKHHKLRTNLANALRENGEEWRQVKAVKPTIEDNFVASWEKNKDDLKDHFVYEFCSHLSKTIQEERISHRKYKKSYEFEYSEMKKAGIYLTEY